MRTREHVPLIKSHQMTPVPRYLLDSVLACSGSLLITGIIFVFQLYPHIPNISIVYLPVVLILASTRGRYAAILSAVLASLFYAYFIVPPFYSLAILRIDEWIALVMFLLIALLTAQLVTTQRKQTYLREHETRRLVSEQAARAEAEAE